MLHPEDPNLFDWRQLASMGDQVQVFTSHVVARDMTHIPVEVHAKRLINGQSEIIQWIHKDITDQVELEAMREDLMAMLFHDLQSPLSNVISGLELLEYELDPIEDDKALTILNIAQRSSQRLGNLIRSLLDISRLEAGHPISNKQPAAISRIIGLALEVVEPSMDRRGVAVERLVARDLPIVVVDQDMITRVLINLLDNALKYSDGGQNIKISAQMLPSGDSVQLAVADEGPGIPEAQRAAIFHKFYRMHSEGGAKGLGLGLAFCRMAVEGHGGRIWVEEAPDGGAMFTFTLPAEASFQHD
jgi:signal transduction histidine kinase